uniref:Uncharacterized protein n=1 Tax=Cannabis sativa TaxID=3483 RepID=A0A803NYD8_CANSA
MTCCRLTNQQVSEVEPGSNGPNNRPCVISRQGRQAHGFSTNFDIAVDFDPVIRRRGPNRRSRMNRQREKTRGIICVTMGDRVNGSHNITQ